jgi:catechol 2,3-dioxygenase-like lactoylglutathione lyase family enzyme
MAPEPDWAALVPELVCSDLTRSLVFYTGPIGFAIRFERPGFAYLALGRAQIMLEQSPGGWETAPLTPPFGRGVNFQIEVASVSLIAARLCDAGVALYRPPLEAWYAANEIEHGQIEMLVQDPDGYLLRFCEPVGERPAQPAPPAVT